MLVKKGDLIFKQGQKGEQAFLIERGQVEIFHTHKNEQESHLAVLGEGEIFGEMALIDTNIRSASTRALTECQLLVIEKEQLIDKLNSSDVVVQLMMRILLKRLRQQNQSKSGVAVENLDLQSGELANADAVGKLKFEHHLYEAFQHSEFVLYHQPIMDLNTGKIAGSEALIRWQSPTEGLVSPGKFVEVLENSSMIIPIGYWIFEEAFRHFKSVKAKAPDLKFSLSINVSGRQFLHVNFIETLKNLVEKHQVRTSDFKLEITERILMEGGSVIDVLNQCHDLGFQISLDDFGTGFSSLQYLSQMPIDFIKIDRSFVMNINDPKTQAVVSSIIYLAKKLNMKIISEGIETAAEAKTMSDLGSDFGQGYHYSKPVDFESFLKKL